MAWKGYPPEFRRRALDLVAAGKTVAEVARLLEVSDQSIYTWRRQEQIDNGELPGLSPVCHRFDVQRHRNPGPRPPARNSNRLTALHVHDARARGCQTATPPVHGSGGARLRR